MVQGFLINKSLLVALLLLLALGSQKEPLRSDYWIHSCFFCECLFPFLSKLLANKYVVVLKMSFRLPIRKIQNVCKQCRSLLICWISGDGFQQSVFSTKYQMTLKLSSGSQFCPHLQGIFGNVYRQTCLVVTTEVKR